MFIEKEYKLNEDGEIGIVFHCDPKALATQSDVFKYYRAARAYTDSTNTTAKVAIALSSISVLCNIVLLTLFILNL